MVHLVDLHLVLSRTYHANYTSVNLMSGDVWFAGIVMRNCGVD